MEIPSACGHPTQVLEVSSLAYETCPLLIWRGPAFSSVSSCPRGWQASFRYHLAAQGICKPTAGGPSRRRETTEMGFGNEASMGGWPLTSLWGPMACVLYAYGLLHEYGGPPKMSPGLMHLFEELHRALLQRREPSRWSVSIYWRKIWSSHT